MHLSIENSGCREIGELGADELHLDRKRASFIINRRIRGMAGRKRLGAAWLVIDPIATSMVYLFVFTVIRSNPDIASILMGIGMYRIFQSSFNSGIISVKDFSGGIKGERVRTRVLRKSMVVYRAVDNSLQSSGIGAILLILGTPLKGVLAFLVLSQILGLISEGVALNLALLAKRVPDLTNLVRYSLLLMFFASPALYPMSLASGAHYRANEFNPFAFFVESARFFSELDSVFAELSPTLMLVVLFPFCALSIRGYSTLDRQRWVVSRWS